MKDRRKPSRISDKRRLDWVDKNCRAELNNTCWLLENPECADDVREWIDARMLKQLPNARKHNER